MIDVTIQKLIEIAEEAGQQIIEVYNQSSVTSIEKNDRSPLTEADMKSHFLIDAALKKLYPAIPILSEESTEFHSYENRKHWNYFFLIDPLDGTKEFIQRNGEFTVNIALIEKNQPIMGVIHAPVLGLTYHATKNKGAYKIKNQQQTKLISTQSSLTDSIRVITSRSHTCEKTILFLKNLETQGKKVISTSVGSALKFGFIAENNADIYPRFSPTMEWDTAAGQILVMEAGKILLSTEHREPLNYNKKDLRNRGFIVQSLSEISHESFYHHNGIS